MKCNATDCTKLLIQIVKSTSASMPNGIGSTSEVYMYTCIFFFFYYYFFHSAVGEKIYG